MIQPQALIKMFGYNAILLKKQIAGLTHAESLIQPIHAPNSLNWLIGHIISSRTRALVLVSETPVWSDKVRTRYRSGSLPITGEDDGVLPFAQLLTDFEESHLRLLRGLNRTSYADLCQPSDYEDNTVGDSLAYFHFHEAYHLGQIADVATPLGNATAWL